MNDLINNPPNGGGDGRDAEHARLVIKVDLNALIARLIYLSAENRDLRRALADRLFAARKEGADV